jgi:hypothetical protein
LRLIVMTGVSRVLAKSNSRRYLSCVHEDAIGSTTWPARK